MSFEQKAPIIMAALQRDLGLTREQAAGVVGNFGVETGGFKHMQELNPVVKGSKGGWGWAQWTGPRRREFMKFADAKGLDPASDEANYAYFIHEITSRPDLMPDRNVLAKLKRARTADEAAKVFMEGFEAPGISHTRKRVQMAKQALTLDSSGAGAGAERLAAVMPGGRSVPTMDIGPSNMQLPPLPQMQFGSLFGGDDMPGMQMGGFQQPQAMATAAPAMEAPARPTEPPERVTALRERLRDRLDVPAPPDIAQLRKRLASTMQLQEDVLRQAKNPVRGG